MIDNIDLEIIKLLQENSRLQWKDIGERIHMTGQGVSARIRRLEDLGIIEKYTLKLNDVKLGKLLTGYIIVLMKNSEHSIFQNFIKNQENVVEAHRVSGDGCYLLKVNMSGNEELNLFLDQLLKYANYRLLLSIDKIKD